MTQLSTSAGLGPEQLRRKKGLVLSQAARLPWTGYFALVVLLGYVLIAFAAPVLAAHSPTDVFIAGPFEPPSAEL